MNDYKHALYIDYVRMCIYM